MKVKVDDRKVFIQAEARQMIDIWTAMTRKEISGLGLVEEQGSSFLVTEVFLPHQVCDNANTDVSEEAVAKLLIEVESQGHDPGQLRFWWHSHADMDTFWSGKDELTIEGLSPSDWFVSSVVNRHGGLLTRIDYFKPLRVTLHDVPTRIELPDFGMEPLCRELFKERVRENGFVPFGKFQQDPCLWDLTYNELINKVTTGEVGLEEAEEILSEDDWWCHDWD